MDHMGRLRGMRDETLGPGIDKTAALAKHPNVFVKLTLIPECSTAPYPYKNIQPAVRRLIEAFGPRRSFWGTDLSVMLTRSTCTYPQAVALFTEEMKFLSPEDLEWIMGRGIAECLGWPAKKNGAARS
jgi:predicted TIM-barrel fold metal-dependent hydrolase